MDAVLALLSENTTALIGAVVGMFVGIANVITMLMPSTTNSKAYNIVMKVLNWLSLNVLKNKNADDT